MLKILDNKYKIQTFFEQVAEILDKEEEIYRTYPIQIHHRVYPADG